ncbi:hypothetical protein BT63DRAFT_421636 [Microthyrium microscopicum]|uniref:Membrane-associated proteins in eicosanoid and glutathione metabolism n=1 Tax=Microthyrium microscopicum TaxID=703497 RepID=A0A6A6UMM0_9PEZI|nr:hypothetical protein BT63DRAFT_421636 [Microthyrium microscopicum]
MSSISHQPNLALLAPLLTLNAWTFIVEIWMYKARLTQLSKPEMKKYHNSMTRAEFDNIMPPQVRWVADNYNHMHEQPTQFYAINLALVMLGTKSKLDLGLAWGYVGLRVWHSLEQGTRNHVMTRFKIFVSSSVVLAVMTARAAWMFWGKMA